MKNKAKNSFKSCFLFIGCYKFTKLKKERNGFISFYQPIQKKNKTVLFFCFFWKFEKLKKTKSNQKVESKMQRFFLFNLTIIFTLTFTLFIFGVQSSQKNIMAGAPSRIVITDAGVIKAAQFVQSNLLETLSVSFDDFHVVRATRQVVAGLKVSFSSYSHSCCCCCSYYSFFFLFFQSFVVLVFVFIVFLLFFVLFC